MVPLHTQQSGHSKIGGQSKERRKREREKLSTLFKGGGGLRVQSACPWQLEQGAAAARRLYSGRTQRIRKEKRETESRDNIERERERTLLPWAGPLLGAKRSSPSVSPAVKAAATSLPDVSGSSHINNSRAISSARVNCRSAATEWKK